jgi:hypothetical protein
MPGGEDALRHPVNGMGNAVITAIVEGFNNVIIFGNFYELLTLRSRRRIIPPVHRVRAY